MNICQIPMADDRKSGYKFLQRTSTGALHAGEDLNSGSYGEADFGKEVRPTSEGEVVFVKNAGAGWGNIIVIWHEHLKRWSRCAHFSKVYAIVGQQVSKDSVIGLCGKSGTKNSHCHWEIIKKKLPTWTTYTNGWSRAKVLEHFESPYEFIKKANMDKQIPDWGVEPWDRAVKKGIAPADPFKEIDTKSFQQILKDAGIIKEVGSLPAYRLIVIIDRLQQLALK